MTTPLDEQYTLDPQDPNDPVWETDANIADMQRVDDPADEYQGYQERDAPAIRNSSGVLDFLNDLSEDVNNFLQTDVPVRPKRPRIETIRTRELGSDKWRPGLRTVLPNMSGPIITESTQRRRVTIINYGPNLVYIGAIAGIQPGGVNTVRVPVSSATVWSPLILSTQDNVWGVVAAGLSQVLEIIEEFDMED